MKKDALLTILIFVLISLCLAFLFRDGENKLVYEASHGYTIIKFDNASDLVDLSKKEYPNVQFSIKNLELTKNTYQVDYFVNNELIDSLENNISTDTEKTFTLTDKVIERLTSIKNQTGNNLSILADFKVRIRWTENEEVINKKIILE